MRRAALLTFAAVVLAAFALIWGAESLYPKTDASAVVLVAVTGVGLWIARPGWHLRPARFSAYWLVPIGLLLASAAGAGWFLMSFEVPLPYGLSTRNLWAAMPAILLITGIEELLFRQVMYRWLEQRGFSGRSPAIATALAFSWAHLGPVFLGSAIGATFYLLQSAYMAWIGILLGEIRRRTESWAMAWLGHFCYNLTVLYVLHAASPGR